MTSRVRWPRVFNSRSLAPQVGFEPQRAYAASVSVKLMQYPASIYAL